MNRPLIGVLPLLDTKLQSLWMLPQYFNAIEKSGGTPLMLPLSDKTEVLKPLCLKLDGILFTGGQDVDPCLYGEKISNQCGEISSSLDEMCRILLNFAMEKDLPLFGICRGLQILNVLMGGSLYQDLMTAGKNFHNHHQQHPYSQAFHQEIIKPDGLLYKILGKRTLNVTSVHHQGIKKLADPLTCEAKSDDNLIEAASCDSFRFMLAVQWHPEYSFENDEDSRKLFKAFIDAC